MNQSAVLSLCAGAFLLTGCLHTVASPQAAMQKLVPVYTEKYPTTAEFLEYSGNGKTFIAAGGCCFVNLYEAFDYKKLAALNSESSDDFDMFTAIRGAGYIDDNTWYFSTDEGDASASIRQIEPPRELYKHNLGRGTNRPVIANKSHLAFVDTLLDWHNDASYKVIEAHPGWFGYTLTSNSRVMTYNVFNGDVLFYDPVKQESMSWNTGFRIGSLILSADERYAVVHSDQGKCVLWQLPEKERLGSCGSGELWGEKWTRSVFQRDGRAFAVSTDNEIRVYTVQPYKLLTKVTMGEKPVISLALDSGRLAAGNEDGMIRVWNVADGSSLGEYTSNPTPKILESVLAFQPNGTQLAVSQSGKLIVFDLGTASERAAKAP